MTHYFRVIANNDEGNNEIIGPRLSDPHLSGKVEMLLQLLEEEVASHPREQELSSHQEHRRKAVVEQMLCQHA